MPNEFATLPYLAPISPLTPRLIAADFTHEVIERDVMVQTLLDGVQPPSGSAPTSFADIAADLDAAGLNAADLRKAAGLVDQHRAAFDGITRPRLLSGDFWTVH
jgi:hypothetical protein